MELKYEVKTLSFGELENKIEIPRFQRGLVWADKKKREFIKTLKKGLPVGALLLSKKEDGKYLVIDGLQRFSTMLDYSKNYFAYIDDEEVNDKEIMQIIFASNDASKNYFASRENDKDRYIDSIRKVIVDCISFAEGKNELEISREIVDELCKKISIIPKEDEQKLTDKVYNFVDNFVTKSSISDTKIAVIEFSGSESELADVYQKLNQEGVKLSKYDVFSATWVNKNLNIENDKNFIELVINKYKEVMKKSQMEVYGFEPEKMIESGEITCYEYAFALGKILYKECPKLFQSNGEKERDGKIEALSFLLLTEIFGLSYSDMSKLADKMMEYKEILDYKKLKDAIVSIAKDIEKKLDIFITAPTKQQKSLACHADFQIASFILVLFKLKYEIDKEKGLIEKQISKEYRSVKEYMHQHYLYDIIRGYWAGSGDSKLEDIISNPKTCSYVLGVDKTNFELAIHQWLQDGNSKNSLSNVSVESKLFYNYYLRMIEKAINLSKTPYDIEHFVPQNVQKNYFIDKGIQVPISAPSNIAYIPCGDNRGKGEKTYYQKRKEDPSAFCLNNEQLDRYLYPNANELIFLESKDTLTKENYLSFLKNRENEIAKRFIAEMYHDN